MICDVPEHVAVVYVGNPRHWGMFIMDWRKWYPLCKTVIINDEKDVLIDIISSMKDDSIWQLFGFDGNNLTEWSKKYMLRVIFENLPLNELYKIYDKDGTLFVFDKEPNVKPDKGKWMVI